MRVLLTRPKQDAGVFAGRLRELGHEALSVPLLHDGYIHMKGRKVFSEAVRSMVASAACIAAKSAG